MIVYTKKEVKQFMDGLDSGSEYMKQMARNFRYFSYKKMDNNVKLNDAMLKRSFKNQVNPDYMIPKIYFVYFDLMYDVPLKKIPLFINPTPNDFPSVAQEELFKSHKEFIKYIVKFRLSVGK